MTDINSLSEKEYRAFGVESFSSIKHLLDSPQTFKHYKEKPFKGSPSTLLGTCIHHYLQGNRHLVAFNPYTNTKKNQEAIKEFETNFFASAGEEGIIVPASFEEKLSSIMKSFQENKQAASILMGCEFESAYLFLINGIELKGKIDAVHKNYIVEIKSSSQATTAEEFKKEALERDYDLQAYLYTVAAKKEDHYFVVVNTTDPYKVAVYRSSYEFIASGHKKALLATERYKKYILGNEEWNDTQTIEEI